MRTNKLKIFKNGKDMGYIGKESLWWFNTNIPNSFSIFDLDSLYPDVYFSKDHVPSELIEPIIVRHHQPVLESLGIADFLQGEAARHQEDADGG